VRRIISNKPTYFFHSGRIKFLWLTFVFIVVIIVGRLFWLQVIKYDDFAELAAMQHDIYQDIAPERGIIYAQNTKNQGADFSPLAINQEFYLIYGQTFAVENSEQTANKMNEVLDLPQDVVQRIITQLSKINDPYEPLVHRVTEDKIKKIEALGLPGIKWEKESLRYYPQKNISSNVLGFVGWVDDKLEGQYGIEGYFNEELRGEYGWRHSERDAQGTIIGVGEQNFKKAVNGSSIVLTIDDAIQNVACQKLNEAVEKYDAEGGSAIFMNPKTGAILAMCGSPDFDPNAYSEVKGSNVYTNPAIFSAYEPGSVFKIITMAAALDAGKIEPETTYEDTGEAKIGSYSIKNSDLKAHGVQTMVDVLKWSLNTGAIWAMRQTGYDTFRDYVRKFGFGDLTGITLKGEMAGDISSLNKKGDIYPATASFGQGIMATPLQMVNSYSTIANGGKMMKPYIVEKIIDSSGNVTKYEPQELRRVITPRTASLLSGMMVQVLEAGHTPRARVPAYYLAGKTGTAEVASSSGGYGARTIHTFIGFGPVSNPVFVGLIRLDYPTAAKYADSTAAPTFAEIAKFILNYYEVKAERTGE
jgi:cell division protein FtsI/penicillin-binding protein 2